MAGVNKVILVGNLGADPEARSLNNGGEVVNMRVATSENWKDRDGNRQERTEWHKVVIFNENLGRVAKSPICARARKVYLEGQIQTRKWQDSRATTNIRPRSSCSASAASWCCSTAVTAAEEAAAATSVAVRNSAAATAAAAARSASSVRSRRRSTPTSTTTFRSRA